MMEEEIWKPIVNCNGYFVSNLGRVKSANQILSQFLNKNGYYRLRIKTDDGTIKNFQTHRLVAVAFLPNLSYKGQVDHINGDKTDNRASNIRWVTAKENSNNPNTLCKLHNVMKDKSFLNKRWERRKELGGKTSPKTIYMYSKDGTFIKEFPSIQDAAKYIGKTHATISVAIDSKTRTAAGYVWRSKKNKS